MKNFKFASLLTVFLVALIFFTSCAKKSPDQPEEEILVRIGNESTISVNEFIRRAEYVPRPAYCRRNTYLDKKIVLNSLIAEKLMAIEAAQVNPFKDNEQFNYFLLGRKEQAMRQWMHHTEATAKVVLDTTDIKHAYQYAGREVEISHVLLSDSSLVNEALQHYQDKNAFDEIARRATGGGDIPQRKVRWEDNELESVHKALFNGDLEIGQVLPPVKVENNQYLMIKIDGWSDEMAMTETQRQQRLTKVTDKLSSQQTGEIWTERVAGIMKGKSLEFNPETFEKLSGLFFDIYFSDDEEKQEKFVEKIWGVERDETKKTFYLGDSEDFLSQSFFTVDGVVWTVDDFRRELLRRPITFRQRKMPSHEFAEQFRLAVADIVRDHYVTEEAYRQGYDKVNVVERNTNMWRDRFLALYQKKLFLEAAGEKRDITQHQIDVIEETLNPYVDALQKKYYKQIELNFDKFEEIQLTTIDLFVKQPEMPYKYVVPMFPVLTNDHLLEYVKDMKSH